MSENSNRENLPQPHGGETDLTRLALSLVAVFFAYWLFLRFEGAIVVRRWTESTESPLNRYLRLGDAVYPLRASFLLLVMIVLLWLFWPVSELLRENAKLASTSRLALDLVIGIAGGLAGLVITIPFLWGVRATPFIAGLAGPPDPFIGLNRILSIVLIGLLVPIGTEFVFRAIVQGMLTAHMSPLAAMLVSAVLGASLWSIFSFPFSLALGLLCGVLFWWRGTLFPAIVADIVMTLSAAVYVGLRV